MNNLEIERLNLTADGLTADGRSFERTLPGEVITLAPDGTARIVTPSTDRVAAPCRHFKSCGGCALQHASDEFVASWKTQLIETGLAARGIETEIRPIKTSPAQSRRRAVLHGKRTKKGAQIGFHGRRSDALIEVPSCLLLDPSILDAQPMLEALTEIAASRKSEVSFTVNVSQDGLDIDVTGGKDLDPRDIAQLSALVEAHQVARLSWAGEAVATRIPPAQFFGDARVVPPPGAFLQATAHAETELQNCVAEALGSAKQVVDLFSGCGTFTLPAAKTAEVWALEGEDDLIAALDTGWRQASGLKKVTALTRDLFRRPVLASEFKGTHAVIIDPPRAGAEAQTHELAGSDVPRIASVSCNPVSFARDAEILTQAGYRLDWVQPIDQFRWSSHVELAAQFSL